MAVDDFLGIPYKMVSSDNFEAYLEAMGVQEDIRSLILSASPTLTLTKSGGTYTANYDSPVRKHVISFTPGVEFDDQGIDGRIFRSVVTMDGNKMLHEVKGDPPSVVKSEFKGDKVFVEFNSGGVIASRVFEKA